MRAVDASASTAREQMMEREIAELQARLSVAEETLLAIQSGEVDAVVVNGASGSQVFTLRGAEHPYRVLVEDMAQGAVTLSADGTIAYCNRRFAEMLKRPLGSITGHSLRMLLATGESLNYTALEEQAWRGSARGEVRFATGDSGVVATYLTLSSVHMDGDHILCLIATDLSEQKRDEALLAEERLARSILESAADGILVCDDQGRIIRASEMACRLAGRRPILENIDAVFYLLDHTGKPFSLAKALNGQKHHGLEVKLISPSRPQPCDLLLSIGPIHNCQSEQLGAVITLTDITERKAFERALAEAKTTADTANQTKSAFLANMSHEIRTPLGAILGFAELLQERNFDDGDEQHFFAAIRRNGHELTRLIDDILDLAKVEVGKVVFEQVEFSLPEFLTEVTTSLRLKAHEKGIGFRVDSAADLPERIIADPTRMRQVVMNIAGNAIKFTTAGEVVITVGLTADAGDKQRRPPLAPLAFLVEDSGRGMTEEQQALLFQPFVQADSSTTRKFGGTGLGLVLSKRLAEALGGDVQLVRSRFGEGSTFAITMRVAIASERSGQALETKAAQATKAKKASAEPTPAKKLEGLRILLAEDAQDNQFLIKRILIRQGAEVDIASNGFEAVEKAERRDYDLVLMDLQMPLLDGHGATQQLIVKGYKKPIVALTAHAMNEERDRCLRSGYSGFLTKPVNSGLLLATVATLAGKRAAVAGRNLY